MQTFTEVAFASRITPAIVASSLAFALGMGIAGGRLRFVLPASR